MTRISLAAIRKQLLERGCTMLPTCPVCMREVAPKDWAPTASRCRECDLVMELDYQARMRAEFHEDGSPKPERPEPFFWDGPDA